MLLIFAVVLGVNQGAVYIRDHSLPTAAYCPAPGPAVTNEGAGNIDTTKLCNDTGFNVIAGTTYRLEIIPDVSCKLEDGDSANPWRDLGIPASPRGISSENRNYLVETLSTPLSRFPTAKLFSPVIQIGANFPEYPAMLDYNKWRTLNGNTIWRGRFKAETSGRAYYYVNDALMGFLPNDWQWFYQNNCGTGKIRMEAIY